MDKFTEETKRVQKEESDLVTERWNFLHERLRVQEEKSAQRDKEQGERNDEQRISKKESDLVGQLKDTYQMLRARYALHTSAASSEELAIPDAWLEEQPEILKDPALLQALAAIQSR